MNFDQQSFVITGGSGGIGKATAMRIHGGGGTVLATGTNADKLATLPNNNRMRTLVNDAADPGAAETLAEHASKLGKLDGVFLNAGYGEMTPLSDLTAEKFDRQYAVNVRGVLLHARHLAPLIKEGGSILITASVGQWLGMEGGALYNSTKGAIRTAARCLAAELAGSGVRVNCVSPGPIETDFFERTGTSGDDAEKMAEGIKSMVPMGRFGTADEVAAVAAFMLSKDASYINAADFVVDGGMVGV